MTTGRTTALLAGILFGIVVAVVGTFAVRPPLVLVLLRDDFSHRTVMKDDPNEPLTPQDAEVIFFPVAKEEDHPDPEPEWEKPQWNPDTLAPPRTRASVVDPLPPKR